MACSDTRCGVAPSTDARARRTGVLHLDALLMAVAGGDSEGGLAGAGGPGASQDLEVAPESEERSCRFLGLDGQGWLQIVGGSVIGLIALYSSYDHINVFGRLVSLNQQRGVSFIIASLAVVFVVAEGFCAAVAQLASRSRLRAENEAAQFRRARVEAEARHAQLAQVLSKLSSSEVRALFEDEALEKALGLRLSRCGAQVAHNPLRPSAW